MKTSERTLAHVKHALLVVILMLAVQVSAREDRSHKGQKELADSTYIVASLSAEAVQISSQPHVFSRAKSSGGLNELLEEDMYLEDWMLSPNNEFWSELECDLEDEIELEPWMMDAALW